MIQHDTALLELIAAERHRQTLRDAEQRRLVALATAGPVAAAAAPLVPGAHVRTQPTQPAVRLLRASLYRAGALLIACGLLLLRWAAYPAPAEAAPSC